MNRARLTFYNGLDDQYGDETSKPNPVTGLRRAVQGVTVAVDPKVIPYGSRLKIPSLAGYGEGGGDTFIAHDTGGDVIKRRASGGKDPVIDVYSRDAKTNADLNALNKKYGENSSYEILPPEKSTQVASLDPHIGSGGGEGSFLADATPIEQPKAQSEKSFLSDATPVENKSQQPVEEKDWISRIGDIKAAQAIGGLASMVAHPIDTATDAVKGVYHVAQEQLSPFSTPAQKIAPAIGGAAGIADLGRMNLDLMVNGVNNAVRLVSPETAANNDARIQSANDKYDELRQRTKDYFNAPASFEGGAMLSQGAIMPGKSGKVPIVERPIGALAADAEGIKLPPAYRTNSQFLQGLTDYYNRSWLGSPRLKRQIADVGNSSKDAMNNLLESIMPQRDMPDSELGLPGKASSTYESFFQHPDAQAQILVNNALEMSDNLLKRVSSPLSEVQKNPDNTASLLKDNLNKFNPSDRKAIEHAAVNSPDTVNTINDGKQAVRNAVQQFRQNVGTDGMVKAADLENFKQDLNSIYEKYQDSGVRSLVNKLNGATGKDLVQYTKDYPEAGGLLQNAKDLFKGQTARDKIDKVLRNNLTQDDKFYFGKAANILDENKDRGEKLYQNLKPDQAASLENIRKAAVQVQKSRELGNPSGTAHLAANLGKIAGLLTGKSSLGLLDLIGSNALAFQTPTDIAAAILSPKNTTNSLMANPTLVRNSARAGASTLNRKKKKEEE